MENYHLTKEQQFNLEDQALTNAMDREAEKRNRLKSENVLISLGIGIDTYPADACFGEYIGTYSKDRQTVCIMIEDNLLPEEQENFESCILPKDIVKEIAYTCTNLITNFGCEVHSHTMKTVKPFTNLKITKYVRP